MVWAWAWAFWWGTVLVLDGKVQKQVSNVDFAQRLCHLISLCEAIDDSRLVRLRERINRSTTVMDGAGAAFDWVRGELLEAAERGDWVILNNVNEVRRALKQTK